MRGLHLHDGVLSFRTDLPRPEAQPGWSRIRVTRAGVCATDLALCRGYMGFEGTPGHEFVGVALDGPHRGRRVVGEINAACGRCASCAAGLDRHCPHRSVLGILGHGGAFAEEVSLPDRNLLVVPDAISDDAATFAEPLAAALQIGEQVQLGSRRRAVVAGDGRLGLLCAHALHHAGCAVTVAGRHPERARCLPDAVVHRTGLLEADGTDPTPQFDLAVEATGRGATLGRLLPWMEPRATIVLKTTTEAPLTVDLSLAVINELSIVGSRCGRFGPALDLLATGRVPVERWVEARYPLDAAAQALTRAAQPGTLKVLVDVS